MKRLFIVALMLGSTLIAGEVKYICPGNGVKSVIVDGKEVLNTGDWKGGFGAENFIIKTTWYGQPIYLQTKGGMGPIMIKSTQSKLEWIQSNVMTFKTEMTDKGVDVTTNISVEKGDAPIIKWNGNTPNGVHAKSITAKMQCYKQ